MASEAAPEENPTKVVAECLERTGNVHKDLLHLFETGEKADCAFQVGSELTGFEVSNFYLFSSHHQDDRGYTILIKHFISSFSI
jgi:hypothetical protein